MLFNDFQVARGLRNITNIFWSFFSSGKDIFSENFHCFCQATYKDKTSCVVQVY